MEAESASIVDGSFWVSRDFIVDTDTLFVDTTNDRVGINNAAPSVDVDVTGEVKVSGDLTVDNGTLYVDSTNNMLGVGTTSPSYKLDVSAYNNSVLWAPATTLRVHSTHGLSEAGAVTSLLFSGGNRPAGFAGITVSGFDYSSGNGKMRFHTVVSGTMTEQGYFKSGFVVGAPAGADNGKGTINAQAVYDDNTLLTCYVIDAVEGGIIQSEWDDRVPDRVVPAQKDRRRVEDEHGVPVLDDDGNETFEEIEVVAETVILRTHEPAESFALRSARDLDPDSFYADMMTRKALPAMPTRQEWVEKGALSTGDIIQRLWETAEVMAVHDQKQSRLIKALEARVIVLEGA